VLKSPTVASRAGTAATGAGTGASAAGTTANGPFPLLDNDGSAIMIHDHSDDYADMDSAASRIACGVVGGSQ
jgi:Cu/Zn superoxide dismutase